MDDIHLLKFGAEIIVLVTFACGVQYGSAIIHTLIKLMPLQNTTCPSIGLPEGKQLTLCCMLASTIKTDSLPKLSILKWLLK